MPRGRYVRRIEHGDFSLEANTEATPEEGQYYLLRGGEVLLQGTDFGPMEAAYKALCREHWEDQLTSESPEARLASAWGLLGLDAEHPEANATIKNEGSAADRKRLEQTRNRHRFQARQGPRGRKPAGA